MALDFEFLSPNDKPALLAISNDELQNYVSAVAQELGYKVHAPTSHEEFATQFTQIQYQIVILHELFACSNRAENQSLIYVQNLPMQQRRHAAIFLIGSSFKSLDAMQAFHQSVHAVIHPADLESLGQIILKVVADNDLFLSIYRDTQQRIVQGSI